MNRRRLARTALLALAGIVVAPSAFGCGLTDALYGRPSAVAAVPVTGPVTVGYTPYTANFAPSPYIAGYTPVLGLSSGASVLPLAGTSIYAPPSNGYAVQRPAYGAVPLENPSVYTGLPVTSGYRGLATSSNPFYGTGNIYPDNYSAASPVTAYRPDIAGAAPVAGYAPAQPQFATPIRSGLARFFNSLLGNGYSSAYYPAQVTYYRPATTLDPVLGTAVTVQQPCTSTIEQLQRTPYTTFDSIGSNFAPAPMTPQNDCSINPYGPSGYGSSGYGSSGYGSSVGSGIQQTGDLQPVDQPSLPTTSFSPPSTQPSPYANTVPLTGSTPWSTTEPMTGLSPLGADQRIPSSSDRAPLEAPSLDSARSNSARPPVRMDSQYQPYERPTDEDYEEGYGEADRYQERQSDDGNDRYDQPEQRDEPPASYYERSRYELDQQRQSSNSLTTRGDDPRSRVLPIPAPADYRNPFETADPIASGRTALTAESNERQQRSARPMLEAPDLLPPLPRPSTRSSNWEQTSERRPGTRLSVPVREASILGERDRVAQPSPPMPAMPARSPENRAWQSVNAPLSESQVPRTNGPRTDGPLTNGPFTNGPAAETIWYSLKK